MVTTIKWSKHNTKMMAINRDNIKDHAINKTPIWLHLTVEDVASTTT